MASPTGYVAAKRPKTLGTNSTGVYEGVYNPATTYDVGDIVRHEGHYWKKLTTAAAGTEPAYNSAAWEPAVVAGAGGRTLDPAIAGGTDTRVKLGPNEGQPSSSQLAKVSSRTAAEA